MYVMNSTSIYYCAVIMYVYIIVVWFYIQFLPLSIFKFIHQLVKYTFKMQFSFYELVGS